MDSVGDSILYIILIDNTYSHSDTCNLPDLQMLFKGNPHLEVLLKGRRWARTKARIRKVSRTKISVSRGKI